MPGLTKESVLIYLKEKSDDKPETYWRLNSWLYTENEEYHPISFKGNKYSVFLKAYKYLLEKDTDIFYIFELDEYYYEENDVYCQYATFKESVEDYIQGFFNGDTLWLTELQTKPVIF